MRHREEGEGPPVLLVHGYPESSYMWRELMPRVAAAGFRALAPDLAGFGDSEPDPPGTWERHVESLERFRTEHELDDLVLVVHDWGGLIGLRWACEHPGAARAIVISSTGFFPDGKWHGMAKTLRKPGEGEALVNGLEKEALAAVLAQMSPGITSEAVDEYWKAYSTEERRRGQLELYRSGDFSKLERYDLAGLGVPVLLLWGSEDQFAPVAGAHRFARELVEARLEVIDGAGHFVFEDEPERCAEAVTGFLGDL